MEKDLEVKTKTTAKTPPAQADKATDAGKSRDAKTAKSKTTAKSKNEKKADTTPTTKQKEKLPSKKTKKPKTETVEQVVDKDKKEVKEKTNLTTKTPDKEQAKIAPKTVTSDETVKLADSKKGKGKRFGKFGQRLWIYIVSLILALSFSTGLFLLLRNDRYTVRFYENGVVIRSIEIAKEKSILELDVPTLTIKNGYEFSGWYTNPDGRGEPFDFVSTKITSNLNLYAGINPKLVSLKIHLNDGTEKYHTITGWHDNLIKIIDSNFEAVLKGEVSTEYSQNYSLQGFDENQFAKIPTHKTSAQITLYEGEMYAIWKGNDVTTNISSEEGRLTTNDTQYPGEDIVLDYGTKYTVDISKYAHIYQENTGARVDGIDVTHNGTTKFYGDGEEIDILNDMEFKLHFADEINKLTIDFNNGDNDITYYGHRKIVLPPTATREFYNLNGYLHDGGNYPVGTEITILGESKYIANWDGKTFIIKLDNLGADVAGTDIIYQKYGSGYFSNVQATIEISSITPPSRVGYDFLGYFLVDDEESTLIIDTDGNFTDDVTNVFFTSNVTLVAKFEIKKYNITLSPTSDYGTISQITPTNIVEHGSGYQFKISLEIMYNQSYDLLLSKLQENYSSVVRVSIEEDGITFEIRNIVSDLHLEIPTLTLNKYKVQWRNYNGALIEEKEFFYNDKIEEHPVAIRTGDEFVSYEFIEWDNTTEIVTENLVFVATYIGRVKIPTSPQPLEYNGDIQTAEIVESEYYTIADNTAINVGNYFARLSLIQKDTPLTWENKETNEVEIAWQINPAKIIKPTAPTTSYTYIASDIEIELLDLNLNIMSVTGNTGYNAGDYEVVVSLLDKENYAWDEDGTNDDVNISWTITRVALMVTAKNKTMTYSDAVPKFDNNPATTEDIEFSGFMGEDNAANSIKNYFEIFTTATSNSNIGTYDIELSKGDATAQNYDMTFKNGYIIITRKGGIVKPTLKTHTFVYTGTQIQPEILDYDFDIMLLSGETFATNANNYTINIELNNNYAWADEGAASISLAWQITPAELTITADHQTRTYNQPNPKLTFKTQTLLGDDILENVIRGFSINTTAVRASNVGMYDIIITGTVITANYTVEITNAQLEITPIYLTKPEPLEPMLFVYNGEPKELIFSLDFDQNTMRVTENIAVNAGDYTAIISLLDTTNYRWVDDGSTDQLSFAWYITRAKVQEPELYGTLTYNKEPQSPHISLNSNYSIYDNIQTDAGVYNAIVSLNDKHNYEWEKSSDTDDILVEWEIFKAHLKIPTIVQEIGNEYLYNGYEQQLDLANFDDETMIASEHIHKDVYEYTALVAIKDLKNYEWEDSTNAEIKIQWQIVKADLIIKANDQEKVYGDEMPNLTVDYIGFMGADNKELFGGEEFLVTTNAEIKSPVTGNPYIITVEQGDVRELQNYNFIFQTGELIVTPKTNILIPELTKASHVYKGEPINILDFLDGNYDDAIMTASGSVTNTRIGRYSFTLLLDINYSWDGGGDNAVIYDWMITPASLIITAIDTTKVYGEDIPKLEYTTQTLLGEDKIEDVIDSLQITTTARKNSDVGEYDIVLSGLQISNNYTLEYVNATLTIVKKALIKPTLYGDTTFVYNRTEHTVSISNVDTEVINLTGNKGTNASTYFAELSLRYSKNYIWEDNTSESFKLKWQIIAYEATIPTISQQDTFEYNAQQNTITLSDFNATFMKIEGNSAKDVGNYEAVISLINPEGFINYTWVGDSTSNQSLYWSITSATLIVTVNPVVMKYQDPAPIFDQSAKNSKHITIKGFKGSDTRENAVSGEFYISTSVNESTDIGVYDITIELHQATSKNYVFELENGVIEIVEQPGIVKPTLFTDVYIYTGEDILPILNNFDESIMTLSGDTSRRNVEGLFTLVITLDPNYAWEGDETGGFPHELQWYITPAELIITVHDQTKIYNDNLPAFTYTVETLLGGDELNGIFDNFHITTMATVESDVGSYELAVAGTLLSENYTLTTVSATLSITPKLLETPYLDKETTFVYSGEEYNVSLANIDAPVTVHGDTATDAGDYIVQVVLDNKDNYRWSDGTSSDLEFAWSITPLKVQRPTAPINSYPYSGYARSLDIDNLDENVMTVIDREFKNSGNHLTTVMLNNEHVINYTWEDDKFDAITFEWKITKVTLTVTAHDMEVVYGNAPIVDPDPYTSTNFTITGFMGEDGALSIIDVIDGVFAIVKPTRPLTATSSVGSYALEFSTGEEGAGEGFSPVHALNYEFEFVHATITIVPKGNILKPKLQISEYDYTGRLITPVIEGIDYDIMEVTGNVAERNVDGIYQIKINLDSNYEWSGGGNGEHILSWSILPAKLVITANTQTKIYGDDLPRLTYMVNTLLGGDQLVDVLAGFEIVTDATKDSSIGDYRIWFNGEQISPNYLVTLNGADLTITTKFLTRPVVLGETVFAYNGNERALTIANGDHSNIAISGSSATDAGTYTARIQLIDRSNYAWIGGDTSDIVVTWSIQKTKIAKPTVLGELTYNGTEQTVNIPQSVNYIISQNTGIDAGRYIARVQLVDKVNYSWADSTSADLMLEWNILAKKLIKPSSSIKTFEYNGQLRQLPITNIDASLTIVGNEYKDAGSYLAIISLDNTEDQINYTWSDDSVSDETIAWTITKATLNIKANDRTQEYSTTPADFDKNPATSKDITITGLKGGESAGVALKGSFSISSDVTATTPVGTYNITITLNTVTSDNYTIVLANGVFTVTPKTGIIIPTLSSNEFAYSATTITPSINNLQPEIMTATGELSGKNVKTYTVTFALNSNYAWVGGGNANKVVTWRITPATLIVTAENKTRAFGANNPEFTYTALTLLGSDKIGDVITGFSVTSTATTASAVGSHPIVINGTISSTNYNVQLKNAVLTITPKLLVKPASLGATSFEYDGSKKEVQLSNDFDSALMSVSGNSATNAGSYEVIISLLDKTNYNWVGGGNQDIKISWTITKVRVVKPNVTGSLTYNEKPQSPTIITNEHYTISDNVQTSAGTYTAKVVLKDKNNYTWTDGASADLSLTWSIAKFTPTLNPQATTYAYIWGQTLNSKIINETVRGVTGNIPGVFVFTTPANVPQAGTTTAQIKFTPTDTTNYNTTNFTLSITVTQISITFDSNGGSRVDSLIAQYSMPVSAPIAPTRQHYIFAGWYIDSGHTKAVTWPHVLIANVTFYAKWTPVNYSITFSSSATNGTNSVKYPNSSSAVNIPTVTLPYGSIYTFDLNSHPFAALYEKTTGKALSGLKVDKTGVVYNVVNPNIPVSDELIVTFVFANMADTLTVNYNGGSASGVATGYDNDIYYGLGSNVTAKEAKKEYFTLKGYALQNVSWDNASLGNGISLYTTAQVNNMKVGLGGNTYYAIWEPITINFVYNVNSGTGAANGGASGRYGQSSFKLAGVGTISRVHYSFTGWAKIGGTTSKHFNAEQLINLNSTLLKDTTFDMSTYQIGDNKVTITLYASWSRNQITINFNFNGGTGSPASRVLNSGESVAISTFNPTSISRTGYTFTGWSLTTNGAVITGTYTVPTTTATLYAIWKANTYTVTRTANGGNLGGTVSVTYDASYNFGVPTRTGYTFNGWFDTNTGGTQVPTTGTWKNTSNLTIYARFTSKATSITLNKQSGTGGTSTVTVTYDSAMPTATAPTRVGYTFAGYFDATSGGTQYYTASMASARTWNKDVTTSVLYARWTANKTTVTLDRQSGTGGTASVTATYDSAMPAMTRPTRTGYTFAGYFDAVSGGTAYYNAAGASARAWNKDTAAFTLYARWTANTYTVTRTANGGNLSGTVSVTYNSSYNLGVPTRTGYTFTNWYDAASGGSVVATTGTWTRTSNLTVHARWTANTYTVTRNGNGGTVSPTTMTVTFGSSYNLGTATRTGYTLSGWFTSASGGSQVATTGTWNTAGAMTVYARWTGNKYTVTLNPNSGSVSPTSVSVTYGSSYTLPTPTRTGYTFKGWFSAASGGTQTATSGTWSRTSNATYYAQWTARTSTVTLNRNGGSGGSASVTATYAANMPAMGTKPTRSGFTFAGYYDAKSGGTQYYTAAGASARKWNKTGSVTLYARWTGIAYTVKKTGIPYDGIINSIGVRFSSKSYSTTGELKAFVSKTTQSVTFKTIRDSKNPALYLLDENKNYLAFKGGGFLTFNATIKHTLTANKLYYLRIYSQSSGGCVTAVDTEASTYGIGTVPGESTVSLTTGASYNLGTPSRTGYTFAGWYTAKSGGSSIATSGTSWSIVGNTQIYGRWTANVSTITRNGNGGSSLGNTTATYGSSFNFGVPTRSGYSFDGWYTAASGGTQLTGSSGRTTPSTSTGAKSKSNGFWALTGSRTVYARWSSNDD